MSIFLIIVLTCFTISMLAWVGVVFLYLKKDLLSRITIFLVSLSAGTLMGGAFLHLLPEASEGMNADNLFLIVLLSFIFFFFVEKALHWRHCHKYDCDIHTFGHMNLIGDGLHNFIDGLIIASAFFMDAKLGFATALAIAFHEIPQEIGDFGVLIHAGFKRGKALIINYLVAFMVVIGGVVGYFAAGALSGTVQWLIPFAAGGFIYISASDLMPEIRKEPDRSRSIYSFLVFILGISIMFVVKLI